MDEGHIHRVPDTACVNCGHRLNHAGEPVVGDAPKPGDITVCLYCGHVMAFGPRLALRNLTDEEIHTVAGDPDILEAIEESGRFREWLKEHHGEGYD